MVTVAGLVRQFPEGEECFLSLDGFSVLMRAMQSDEEKLQVKAAFLLANIVLSDQKHKGTTAENYRALQSKKIAKIRVNYGSGWAGPGLTRKK